MAHLYKKIKKGRPYYYIREMRRVGGKPKVVSQIYLGSVATIAKRLSQVERAGKPLRLQSRPFGALFLAHELEKTLDTIGLIDLVVPRALREKGPSIGEHFFYAWVNRLIAPRSKRALCDWYRHTAIGQIRPVPLEELTSQRCWEKWNRVRAKTLRRSARGFLRGFGGWSRCRPSVCSSIPPRLRCRCFQGPLSLYQLHQSPHLSVGDHPGPSFR